MAEDSERCAVDVLCVESEPFVLVVGVTAEVDISGGCVDAEV